MNFNAGDGADQTALDPDDLEGLIPSWVSTRGDLNRAEQENILRAETWADGRTLTSSVLLTDTFIRQLHRRMFGDVWRWAGLHRTRDTNLGVDALSIVESVGQLMGDALYWIENAVFERDELALRFHHRLVAIHPFPNGNGRVSRMIGDLLVVALGNERFTWGAFLAAEDPAAVRRTYIEALRAADAGDVGLLLAFART